MTPQEQLQALKEHMSQDKIVEYIADTTYGITISQMSVSSILSGYGSSSNNTKILIDRAYQRWIKNEVNK